MKKIYVLLCVLAFVISSNAQNLISGSLKDKNGNLWFVVSNHGVYRYDGKTFTNFTAKDNLCDTKVSCIYEDKGGNIWFGTQTGVCYYDGKGFIKLPLPGTDSVSIKKNFPQWPMEVGSILQDKKGNMWFVTLHHGVFKYDGKFFKNFLPYEVLSCIAEDKNGNMLVGSWRQGGVYSYDGKEFTNLKGFSDNMIFCMLKDKDGNVWVGTRDHGIDRYDGKAIVNFSEVNGLSNTNVSCLYEDKKGNLWIGSDVRGDKRGDAFCYNGDSFKNVTEKADITLIENFTYNVRTIVEDNQGNMWFGSRDGFLIYYNGEKFIDVSDKLEK